MKRAVATVIAALAAVPAASASLSAPLSQQVRTAATRAGFSGEVAVARHGRIVFAHGYGLANRPRGRRVTLDTAFNLASMGKMFTGVAAAQLVEAGRSISPTGSGSTCHSFLLRCGGSRSPSCSITPRVSETSSRIPRTRACDRR